MTVNWLWDEAVWIIALLNSNKTGVYTTSKHDIITEDIVQTPPFKYHDGYQGVGMSSEHQRVFLRVLMYRGQDRVKELCTLWIILLTFVVW